MSTSDLPKLADVITVPRSMFEPTPVDPMARPCNAIMDGWPRFLGCPAAPDIHVLVFSLSPAPHTPRGAR